MQLNIKTPEAHALARQLAKLTGESVSQAVTQAIRERLERERRQRDKRRLVADPMKIAEATSKCQWDDEPDPTAFLYDERGLPRE